MLVVVSILFILFVNGCNESKTKSNLNAKLLIAQKCGSCHNLDLPPTLDENEIAPPMMAVAFHVKSFMQVSDESTRIIKAREFVKDYVLEPDATKSLCDKKSLQDYGLMPSQKGKVSNDELDAITSYMFKNFTQEKLSEAQETQNRLNAMPKGKRIALQSGCMGCHKENRPILGPSFKMIANHYKNTPDEILASINNGSSGKWNIVKKVRMPSFKDLTTQQKENIVEWIISLDQK
jgi:cytochrome c